MLTVADNLSIIIKTLEQLNTYHCSGAEAFRMDYGEHKVTVRHMHDSGLEGYDSWSKFIEIHTPRIGTSTCKSNITALRNDIIMILEQAELYD